MGVDLFEINYSGILKFAEQTILNSKQSRIEANDLVNEAYIQYKTSGASSLIEIKRIIKGIFLNTINTFSFQEDKNNRKARLSEESVCIKCKMQKVASEFRVLKKKNGKEYLSTICKSCEANISTKWQKDHYNSNKNRQNKRKQIETLSDSYIRNLLRNKKPITDDMIKEKKKEIYAMRKQGHYKTMIKRKLSNNN